MKKNFFKKLSFVLALAMVLSTLAPAASAFSATSPSLYVAKKYLYLNEEGKASEYDFNIKDKVAGSTYAWASDNEAVAEVDATGVVTANAVGTAKVSCVITFKDDTTKTLTATVVVRDNIETIDVVAPKDVTAYGVGVEYDFNRSFTTFNGSQTKTSSISRWAVDKTTATIVADSGKFTATEAGEYQVTVNAFQSKAQYEAWLVSKEATLVKATKTLKVVVAAGMTVAQKDLDTLTLTFDSPVTDVKNISLYTMVGTTEIGVTTAKPATLSADKKTATVDFYVPLAEGGAYRVKYTGSKSVDFTAATAKPENVAKVELALTTAEVGKAIALAVKLFDAKGVEITKADLTNRVTYSTTAVKGVYLDSANKTIMFFTKGEAAAVDATFHSYKYEAGKEVGNVVGAGTIVGVDAPSTVVGTVKAWTIVDRAAAPSFSDVKQTITVGQEKKLAVQLNTKTGTTDGTIDSTVAANKITFASSDNTILFVDNATGFLYPVKAGVVTIVVKQDGNTVDVITVTVGETRKATSIVLGKTDLTLSNAVAVNDTTNVSVKVKDQYGDDFAVGAITITKLTGSPATLIASTTATDVVFNGVVGGAAAVKGTYYYEVKAQGLTAYVTALVIEPDNSTPVVKLALGATEVDNKSVKDAARPTIAIDIFGYAAGAKVTKPAVTGAGYTVVVKDADGTENTLATGVYNLTTVSGTAITAKKAGTYTVTLKNASGVALDIQYFTVKNTQAKPSFELKTAVYTKATLNEIAQECVKVSFGGNDVTASITMGDVIGTIGTNIFVKNVKYVESITDGGVTYTIEHTVDVNQLLTK